MSLVSHEESSGRRLQHPDLQQQQQIQLSRILSFINNGGHSNDVAVSTSSSTPTASAVENYNVPPAAASTAPDNTQVTIYLSRTDRRALIHRKSQC